MNDLVEVVAENELPPQTTSEPVLELNKNRKPKIPKQENEVSTLEDIIDDLRYLTQGYPIAAVNAALSRKDEILPILFGFLNHTLENYKNLEDYYFGHIYALFFLAYFREKSAFSLVMQIASLPGEWPDTLLGDTITEDLASIIASVYDGNISLIQKLIESETTNTWARDAALRSLLILVQSNQLERDWVIQYFKQLFRRPDLSFDEMLITHLVCASADLYPVELYDEIKLAYANQQVDTWRIKIREIDSIISMSKEDALAKYLYDDRRYHLITDIIKSMSWWACFNEKKSRNFNFNDENNDDDDEYDWEFSEDSEIETYRRGSPKIGRNEPCPCGSGKKYKKCCLS